MAWHGSDNTAWIPKLRLLKDVGLFGGIHLDKRGTCIIKRHEQLPRSTTNLAILNVLLRRAATGIQSDDQFLSTMKTSHGCFCIKRRIVVQHAVSITSVFHCTTVTPGPMV